MQEGEENLGLFTAEEDWDTLYLYLEILCEQILAIVRNEPKILRLTSPLYVIGDIQGSLNDLFLFEGRILHSIPVLSTTVLFLGNYSGSSFNYGVECIIYLMAIKVLMPNKVYLLRGRNELRAFNENNFLVECHNKYGTKYGSKIYDLINRAFDSMPIAATVDDSILCTHSGIPRIPVGMNLLATIEANYSTSAFAELCDPQQTFPIAYEVIFCKHESLINSLYR